MLLDNSMKRIFELSTSTSAKANCRDIGATYVVCNETEFSTVAGNDGRDFSLNGFGKGTLDDILDLLYAQRVSEGVKRVPVKGTQVGNQQESGLLPG